METCWLVTQKEIFWFIDNRKCDEEQTHHNNEGAEEDKEDGDAEEYYPTSHDISDLYLSESQIMHLLRYQRDPCYYWLLAKS